MPPNSQPPPPPNHYHHCTNSVHTMHTINVLPGSSPKLDRTNPPSSTRKTPQCSECTLLWHLTAAVPSHLGAGTNETLIPLKHCTLSFPILGCFDIKGLTASFFLKREEKKDGKWLKFSKWSRRRDVLRVDVYAKEIKMLARWIRQLVTEDSNESH